MFCNKCGHQFEGNFCPKCGAKAKTPLEVPVNTTGNFDEDKNDNPYDVYYKEQPNQAPYEPQYGYQPQKQEAEKSSNVPPQPQYPQPPYKPYHPPYYQVQPPKDKSIKWWQILLIILAVLLSLIMISGSCVGTMFAYDDMYLSDYDPYADRPESKSGFIGDTINSEYFSYSVTDAKYINKFNDTKPKEGYRFLEVTVKAVNTSNIEEYLVYDLHCYADNIQYNSTEDEYSFDFGNLLPTKTSLKTVVFEIPESADSIELNLNDYYTNIMIILDDIQ